MRKLSAIFLTTLISISFINNVSFAQPQPLATFTGEYNFDNFGFSVATAGDVNNDGIDDIIIGAIGNSSTGRTYIFYGGSLSGNYGASQADVIITGENSYDNFGFSVATAGDVNNDGEDDIIIGAYLNDAGGSNAGRAYIFYGGSLSGNYDASQADVIITGETYGDYLGFSVATAGDVNNDGVDDIIIGANENEIGGYDAGRVYIFYGGSLGGNYIASQADVIITGENSYDNLGCSVATAGDVNNDGIDDIIIGARGNNVGYTDTCRAYIFYGGSLGGNYDASQADVIITGENFTSYFGCSVATAGDVNNDGIDDIIIGAYLYYDIGRAYIFYGGTLNGNYDASQADVIITGETYGDNLGFSVATAGDANGDGKDDLIVGAWGNDAGGSLAGRAYIFYGGSLGGNYIASQANVIISGEDPDDNLGYSVATARNVNNDGIDDIIISARGSDFFTGKVYLYAGNQITLLSPQGGELLVGNHNYLISWEKAQNFYPDHHTISYSIDSGNNYSNLIAENISGTDSTFNWLVPPINSSTVRVKIIAKNTIGDTLAEATSSTDFTISSTIILTSPNGGEYWIGGTLQNITWATNGPFADHISILYSTDGGITYPNVIIDSTLNDSSYSWTVPGINSNQVRVMVQARDSNNIVISEDASNNNFNISSTIILTSPNGGEYWIGGTLQNITWATNGPFADHISILYSTDGGITYPNVIIDSTLNDSSYSWTVPGINSNQVRVMVQARDSNNIVISEDASDSNLTIDSTPPGNFTLSSPTNGEWASATPTLCWNSASGADYYQLFIDGSLVQDSITNTCYTIDSTQSLIANWHTWNVVARDWAGNSTNSTNTWSFRVDNQPPAVFNLLAPPDSQWTTSPHFYWQPSSDAQSGLQKYQVYLNGILTLDNISPDSTSISYPSLIDGIHSWKMQAVDSVGNATFSSQEWVVKVDKTPPAAFNLVSPLNYNWIGDPTPTLIWNTTSDAGIGLEKYELYIDNVLIDSISPPDTSYTLNSNQSLSNGNHTWYVKARDKLGNENQSNQTWTIRVDILPPNAFDLILPSDSALVNFPTPNFSWQSTLDNGSGFSHYQLWIDSLLSVDNLTTTSSSSGTPLLEGYHLWYVTAIDNVGNIQYSNETRTVIVDFNPPDPFDLASPANGDTVHVGRPVLSWHPSDDLGSGLLKYELWIGGQLNRDNISPTDTSATPLFDLSNGTYNWYVRAFDIANGVTSSNSTWSFVVDRDMTGPITQILDPVQSQILTSTSYTIQGNVEDNVNGSGVDSVFISTNGGITWEPAQMTKMKNEKFVNNSDILNDNKVSLLNKIFTNSTLKIPEPWTYFWNGYSNGSHLILARAVDLSGNYGNTDSVSVLVDTQPPAVDTCIINPPFVSTDSIYFTVNFIEEGSGLDANYPPTVEFTPVGGTPISVTQTGYNVTTKTWTGEAQITSAMNDGIVTVEIRGARDLAGYTMVVNTNYSFLIDQVPPTNFELVSPDSGIWLNQRSPLFVWHPSNDVLSGLSHYDFLINTAVNVGQISPGDTSTHPASPLSDGTYSWRVDAFDAANNITSSPIWIVKIDSTAPSLSIEYPLNNDILEVDTVSIRGMADDGSGIGIDSLFISTDGIIWNGVNSDSGVFAKWSYDWIIENEGTYTLQLFGRDLLGNSCIDSILVHIYDPTGIDNLAKLGIPKTYELWQNYPNPFNPQTTIVYGLPKNCKVTISIFDILGRKIETFVNESQKAGYHKVIWDASGYSSGIYFYVMVTKDFRKSMKLLLIR